MNTSTIINDSMTLEEKLAAIDQAVASVRAQADKDAATRSASTAPLDQQDILVCHCCQ